MKRLFTRYTWQLLALAYVLGFFAEGTWHAARMRCPTDPSIDKGEIALAALAWPLVVPFEVLAVLRDAVNPQFEALSCHG